MAADPGEAWREQRQRAVEAHAKRPRFFDDLTILILRKLPGYGP